MRKTIPPRRYCAQCGAPVRPHQALHLSVIYADREPSSFLVCLALPCVGSAVAAIGDDALTFASVYLGEEVGITAADHPTRLPPTYTPPPFGRAN